MTSFSIRPAAFATSASYTTPTGKKHKSDTGSAILASSYEYVQDSDNQQTTNGVTRTVYDTNGTAVPTSTDSSKDEIIPGIGYVSTEVHSLAIVNSIFRDADADGDGNLSSDELETYMKENVTDMDADEIAAAKFLQKSYGTLSAQDGDTGNLTLDDIHTASQMQDDDGLSDGDLLRSRHRPTVANALFSKMIEEKAKELGITPEELARRIRNGGK